MEVHVRNRSTGHHRSSFAALRRSLGAGHQRGLRWRRCHGGHVGHVGHVPFDGGNASGDTTYYQLSNKRGNYWSIQCICPGTSLWQCGEVDGKGGLHVIQVVYGGHFADCISRTFVCAWLWRQRLWDISCIGWLQFNKPIHACNCHWAACFTAFGLHVVVSACAASCKRVGCSCGQHLAHVARNLAGCCNCFCHGSLSLFPTDNASSCNQFSCTHVVLGLSWKSHPGVDARVELILQEPASSSSALVSGMIKTWLFSGNNTRWRKEVMVLVWELSSFSIGKISLEIEVIFWVFKIWNFDPLPWSCSQIHTWNQGSSFIHGILATRRLVAKRTRNWMQNITVGEASLKKKRSIHQSSSRHFPGFSQFSKSATSCSHFFVEKKWKNCSAARNWFNRLKQRWLWGSFGMGHGGWSSSMWFLRGKVDFNSCDYPSWEDQTMQIYDNFG